LGHEIFEIFKFESERSQEILQVLDPREPWKLQLILNSLGEKSDSDFQTKLCYVKWNYWSQATNSCWTIYRILYENAFEK